MKNFLFLLALCAAPAFASTDPNQVDKIDTAREGNLRQLVLKFYQDNLKVSCDQDLQQVTKYEIVKVASDSANEEKTPGTPYSYSGSYLVVQKCLYGSTYVGAYSDPIKSVILKGSFRSKYNGKHGPAKMENLQIQYVKDVDVTLPTN